MSDPIFGVVFRTQDEDPRPVASGDLSTVGVIGPASKADTSVFPLNAPVKVYSNDIAKLKYLGNSGYLLDAIRGINDQLDALQVAAQVVVVRTAEGTDPIAAVRNQQTIANIMGSSTEGTGIFAFLKSPAALACTPRLIMAPGFTAQMANSLNTLALTTPGKGYLPGKIYPLTFSGGGRDDVVVQATGHAMADANGEINFANLFIDSYGAWYDVDTPPTVAIDPPVTRVPAVGAAVVVNEQLDSITIATKGEGYAPGQVVGITFAGGGADPDKVLPIAHAVGNDDGEITSADIYIDSAGAHLLSAPTLTLGTPAAGQAAVVTATVAQGANPVVASMPSVLNALLAHAIVESSGISEVADENWREMTSSERIIGLSGGCKVLDPDSSFLVIRPLAPRVAGILVRRDHETGFPFHSAANQPVAGIVGPQRTVGFSLTDGANEGQQLLANNLGIMVRGETGSDFAISSGGFVFVGTDNLGEDELWRFYNVTRGRDFIHISLLKSLRFFLGRFNITAQTIKSCMDTMKLFLRDLQALEQILGYKVDFKGSWNSAEEIRLGHITIGFKAEEPPPLRKLTVMSSRYRPAIDAMVSTLERQLNLAA